MSSFADSVKNMATEYGDADVSMLSVGLAIEAFRGARNYPPSYDDSRILSDMEANVNKIAMAAVEIESKNGVEGQVAHSENGISRTYYSGIMAYRDVIGFARAV